MSLRSAAARLTPVLRQSFRALGTTTTANAGVFAWIRPQRLFSSTTINDLHNNMVWSETLSFSSPESDFVMAVDNVQFAPGHERPLPLTWREALHLQEEAVVITTAQSPHHVVHVNTAWENLCGYTKSEALHKPIGPLLQQGQHKSHTNQAARHLLHQLQADQYAVEHDAYLENFTKNGRAFLNHLRVGPLYLDTQAAQDHKEPDFLIGVLQEVQKKDVPLRMVV
jgi:PAS domain S-box-containing protein